MAHKKHFVIMSPFLSSAFSDGDYIEINFASDGNTTRQADLD
jgi:hypothetical protein